MTFNLLHWVPEGMVLCSDSMVTLTNYTPRGSVITNFEHAEKLVPVGQQLPAAVMINGMGSIAGEMVSVVIKRAGRELDKLPVTPQATDVLREVRDAVHKVYAEKLPVMIKSAADLWSQPEGLAQINNIRKNKGLEPIERVIPERVGVNNDPNGSKEPNAYDTYIEAGLTLIVATYFGESPLAWAIGWPGPSQFELVPALGKQLRWWGSGGVSVSRLMNGLDGARLAFMAQTDPEAGAVLDFFNRKGTEFAMPVPMADMPLQDAVDFAEYMGEVACGFDRFAAGPPDVGGELDLMVLTPGKREWVYKKLIHSRRQDRSRSET